MGLERPCGNTQFMTHFVETASPFPRRVITPNGYLGRPMSERRREALHQPNVVPIEQIAR
jgi:hypothetical protein